MQSRFIVLVVAATLGLALTATQAQTTPPAEAAPPEDTSYQFHFTIGGGYEYGIRSDLQDSGDVQISRFDFNLNVDKKLSDAFDVTLRFNYDLDSYDFSAPNGLAATEPWQDIHTITFGGVLTYAVDQRWRVFGGPVLQYARESDADWSDSFIGGGVLGATYSFSQQLTVGGGIGVLTQLEDDPLVFPVIIINWNFSEDWRVTSRLFGPAGRQGAEVVWNFHKDWEAAFGAAYKDSRFRLDDSGVAPNGVGEETSIPVWLRLGYSFNQNITASIFGGATTMGTLRLEDSDGHKISEQDFDMAPFMGVYLRIEF